MAQQDDIDAVICLGCVIQGETRHFDFICNAVAQFVDTRIDEPTLSIDEPTSTPVVNNDVLDESVLYDLLQIGGGNQDFMKRMLALFEENVGPAIERISSAAKTSDKAELANQVHALKSMAANMGAKKLASTCAVVEKKARGNEVQNTEQAVQTISKELAAARDALELRINAA